MRAFHKEIFALVADPVWKGLGQCPIPPGIDAVRVFLCVRQGNIVRGCGFQPIPLLRISISVAPAISQDFLPVQPQSHMQFILMAVATT